jgi:glycolate oxidase
MTEAYIYDAVRSPRGNGRPLTTTARDVASELAAVVGREHVLAGDIAITLYGRDGSIQDDGECGLVVLPANTDEVSGCMRVAAAAGLDVVPRGSGTGLTGGAVPLAGALVISLTRMNRIIEIDVPNACAWVEPGGFFK